MADDIVQIRNALLDGKQTGAMNAGNAVPDVPGIYATFIDDPNALPEPFRTVLQRNGNHLIYIGISERNMLRRLVNQDLRHQGPSTFFRSLGAVLGYRPEAGSLKGKRNQVNYTFNRNDTAEIVDWIDQRLSVTWKTEVPELPDVERTLIRTLQPLLNIQNNPGALPELSQLREDCMRIARGEP